MNRLILVDKNLKEWTLKKFFPHFTVLVLKQSPISADFNICGFLFPQKISEYRGLPVYKIRKHYLLWIELSNPLHFSNSKLIEPVWRYRSAEFEFLATKWALFTYKSLFLERFLNFSRTRLSHIFGLDRYILDFKPAMDRSVHWPGHDVFQFWIFGWTLAMYPILWTSFHLQIFYL